MHHDRLLFFQYLNSYLDLKPFPTIINLIEDFYCEKIPAGILLDYIEDHIEYIDPVNDQDKYTTLTNLKDTYKYLTP